MNLDFLKNTGKTSIIILGIVLTFLMGFLDYILGVQISISIFYLIPISLVAWYAGKSYGIAFAILCTLIWFWNESLDMGRYSNHAIPFWNALVRLGFFLVVAYLLTELKNIKIFLEETIEIRTSALTKEIMERKNTEEELEKKTRKLSELTKRLQTIREEENEIIAREIHDELGQSLTAMKIEIMLICKKLSNDSDTRKFEDIIKMIDETIKTIRKISTRLRPRLLDQLGFLPALEWELKDFQNRTGIICELFVEEENFDFNSINSTALFRIFQESLTNIARHSKATNVSVVIGTGTGKMIKMVVKDNGVGVSSQALMKEKSLGILGMNERALMLNGILDVYSPPEGGTEVILTAPINQLEAVHD